MATETITYEPGVTELHPNEVWQDTEGCLYTPIGDDEWLAFGNPTGLTLDYLKPWLPFTKVVDRNGKILVTYLNYREEVKVVD